MSGKRRSAIITTIIGGELESSSRSLPFLFIAKKRDGAVQQRGLMSRFYSFLGYFFRTGKTGSHTCFLRQGFSALADWGKRTARGVFVPYGRGVFAEPQRGSAPSADGGDVAAPAAVGKRVDTYGFYPLNSRFPLFLSLAKIGERRPLRNRGTAEDFFYCRGAQRAPISLPLRSVGYIAAKHAGNSP